MNRQEFMETLDKLLYEISPEEKKEALDYYNGYFDEAGEEHEQDVIRELGSPKEVADRIKADLHITPENRDRAYQEYTDTWNTQNNHTQNDTAQSSEKGSQEPYRRNSQTKTVLIVLLCIVCSPMIFAAGGIVVGFLGAAFGILCALVFGGGGACIGGIACTVFGAVKLFSAPGIGLAILGSGFLMLSGGLIAIAIFAALIKLVPRFFRWVTGLFRKSERRER